MNIKQKISTAVASGALILGMAANSAFAATTVSISGNGAFSRNFVSVENNNEISVNQTNITDIRNTIIANARTGNNNASLNTGGDVAIVTGDASTNVTVTNHANHNFLNLGGGSNNRNGSTMVHHHMTGLTGGEEVPGPGDPNGFGFAHITINHETNMLCSHLTVGNIAPPTMAHIHKAPVGVAGPVVVTLPTPTDGSESGCVSVDHSLLTDIDNNPSMYYVNVHNDPYPSGAVRGQL